MLFSGEKCFCGEFVGIFNSFIDNSISFMAVGFHYFYSLQYKKNSSEMGTKMHQRREGYLT